MATRGGPESHIQPEHRLDSEGQALNRSIRSNPK